ncbi:poly-beta-1,6-N-acetyl-D-glucosamine N-deacetylase PgaB [Atlantibacter hermannii]|uniref:poly-beta-1,6-N-acetyl-D-glucosamine N-deacetylase PgaB n=1 Tax=Atlantibacter hermannii TaxID=565 RepID=UPI0035E42500
MYASMPVTNWDFTGDKALAKRADASHWQKIHELYKDLSANNVFHGILFLAQKDREEPERKYAALTSSLVKTVKATRGYSVKTAWQIIAEPGLNPGTDATLSGKINEVVGDFDLTVVTVDPYTNKLPKKENEAWLKTISNQVAHHPASQSKLLIQLEMPQVADGENNLAAFYDVTNSMRLLQLNGVRNYGYTPGNAIIDARQVPIIAPNFSINWYPENA